VLILTADEYDELQTKIPEYCDVLVFNKIENEFQGTYDKLRLPCARRLGIFLFAYHQSLSTFMMIDDNIKTLKMNGCQDWDGFYDVMKREVSNHFCASVRTESFKEVREGELGSKVFMVNMEEIRKRVYSHTGIFSLFPFANNSHYWGEDYYMQIGLHVLANQQTQGYKIISEDVVCLNRSAKERNSFVNTGAKVEAFDPIDEELDIPILEDMRIRKTCSILNKIIESNIKRYQRRIRMIERANLQQKHAVANHVAVGQNVAELELLEGSFMQRFQGGIASMHYQPGFFRPYQVRGFNRVAETLSSQVRMVMATGVGKTYVQCQMMRHAYHAAKNGEHIFVVTPHISLVNQFYNGFIDFNTKETALPIPAEAVIKVCSHKQSCNVKALLLNQTVKAQKCLFIFCADSLEIFLEEMNYRLPNVPLILLDEYHIYASTTKMLAGCFKDKETMLIGLTATPPANDPLTTTVMTYTRAEGVREGYLAPVLADSLRAKFSLANVEHLITCLPELIKLYHPSYEDKVSLKELKGIVYLPTIEHCNRAVARLKENNIRCFSINSKNSKHKKELEEFLESDEPGVLVAVRMLRIGIDDRRLAWGIVGLNGKKNHHASFATMEQILGRFMRRQGDKIGYVLAFENVWKDVLMPLLKEQPVTLPVDPDYLAQEVDIAPFHIEPESIENFEIPEEEDEETSVDEETERSILQRCILGEEITALACAHLSAKDFGLSALDVD
jgi:superfamily II DNA or RNA helicase